MPAMLWTTGQGALCLAALALDVLAAVSRLPLARRGGRSRRCSRLFAFLPRRSILWRCRGCWRWSRPTASSGGFASLAGMSLRRRAGFSWRATNSARRRFHAGVTSRAPLANASFRGAGLSSELCFRMRADGPVGHAAQSVRFLSPGSQSSTGRHLWKPGNPFRRNVRLFNNIHANLPQHSR